MDKYEAQIIRMTSLEQPASHYTLQNTGAVAAYMQQAGLQT